MEDLPVSKSEREMKNNAGHDIELQ